ncbi:hypothetical protein QO200_02695 [Flavobacterium sp. Arc3]|jgi:hypothetical protein|uniref:hypothetical protein n=1 Tax=unclassified Flavobacterium TaxID=196869 RepID=UPI00352FA65F
MKNIKLLAILGIAFFASSTINAQVSVGVNIGLPSIVLSGHYERGYEPQRRTVEYQQERVIYVDNRDYDEDRWYDERRCEEKKHHGKWHKDKKYKERDHDDRYDD